MITPGPTYPVHDSHGGVDAPWFVSSAAPLFSAASAKHNMPMLSARRLSPCPKVSSTRTPCPGPNHKLWCIFGGMGKRPWAPGEKAISGRVHAYSLWYQPRAEAASGDDCLDHATFLRTILHAPCSPCSLGYRSDAAWSMRSYERCRLPDHQAVTELLHRRNTVRVEE